MKRCKDCGRDALHYALYEARYESQVGLVLLRAPYGWICAACARSTEGHHALFSRGKLVGFGPGTEVGPFVAIYQEIGRRNFDLWYELERSDVGVRIDRGISRFNEDQIKELEKAWAEGRTVAEGKRPDVEYLSPEQAKEAMRAHKLSVN